VRARDSSIGIGFALVLIAVGLAMMVFVAVDGNGLNAPLWVVEVALSTFVFAGGSFVARALGWIRFMNICSLSIVYALATPGLWIMLQSGKAQCSGNVGFFTSMLSSLECRIAFGVGGIFTLSYALVMTYFMFRKPHT